MNFVTGGLWTKSSLLSAAGNGDLKTVRSVLQNNPEWITHTSLHGNNALHNAAANGQLHVVVWLVEQGGVLDYDLLDVQDGNGKTPLMRAANNHHARVVEYLEWKMEHLAKTKKNKNRNQAKNQSPNTTTDADVPGEIAVAVQDLSLNEEEDAREHKQEDTKQSANEAGGAVNSTVSSITTKKKQSFGLGTIIIAIPPKVFVPGRDDAVEGMLQLVNVPEPIAGKSLTVRLEAFPRITREIKSIHSQQPIYEFEKQLAGQQQYLSQQQFRFLLPVPVVEPSSRLQLSPQEPPLPLQWHVTAHLDIPDCIGLQSSVSVAIAEPDDQAAPSIPSVVSTASPPAAAAATTPSANDY